jgi:hypothetical protein
MGQSGRRLATESLDFPLLQRVTHEVWQMKKLDLAKLEKAFAGK